MRKFSTLFVACLLAGVLVAPSSSFGKSKTKKSKAKAVPIAAADKTKPAEAKPAEAKPVAGSSAGKDLFLAQKCSKCHKASAEGIAPLKDKPEIVDLSGTGGAHDAAWFKQWLKKEITKDSTVKPGEKVKHKGSWKGTDAELDTIAVWLKGLTAKVK